MAAPLRRRPRALAAAAGLLLLAASAPDASREYRIKAAFLFNFAQFVEWPAAAFPEPTAPFCIGILGQDPFGEALEDLVRGERLRDRQLVVRRSHEAAELRTCQLLFVARSESHRLDRILDELRAAPVLTVGDAEGFASAGGMIGFRLVENRVRFEINAGAARREGLRISSQLLQLGTPVETGG